MFPSEWPFMKVGIVYTSVVLLLAGCANEPIVDRRGVDEAKYQADLAECHTYANQVNTAAETAERGAIGAVIGASVGAVVGGGLSAEQGAGAGAIAGGTEGFKEAEDRKEEVLHRCMTSRGYRVFG